MKNKIYTSFEEIDRELAILKIEKEISYQKIILSGQEIIDFFSPKTLSKHLITTVLSFFTGPSFPIVKFSLPFFFKWFSNRKRSQ